MRVKEVEKVDVRKYVGTKTTVADARIVETKFGLALRIESEDLGEGIKASTMYGFSFDQNEGYFLAKDGKLHSMLVRAEVSPEVLPENPTPDYRIDELIGKPATVQLNTKSGYLDLIL